MHRKITGMQVLTTMAALMLAACGVAETAAPASPVPQSAQLLEIPPAPCCRGQALEAGGYAFPDWLEIPLSVEIPAGWMVMNESRARLFSLGSGENVLKNPSRIIAFSNVTGERTPEELIASVQTAPELTTLSEPTRIMVAGFPGLQLDSTAKPNPSYAGKAADDIPPGVQLLPVFSQYFTPGFLWTTSSPEARVRTIVLEVKEQALLLYLEAPPAEFDSFAAEAIPILETLQLIEK
jgi:hypothetical protein